MLAFTADNKWQIGIGDPTVMGWVTVVAYFGAAILCGRCATNAYRARRQGLVSAQPILFWSALASVLVLLGINKQLDLQTWFTLLAKSLALEQGWYEDRRFAQAVFILVVGVIGLAGLGIAYWLTRRAVPRGRLALLGVSFLGCFVLIRAASFHHVDQLIGFRLAGLKVNWILELSGILIVAVAATRNLRDSRTPPKTAIHRGPVWPAAADGLSETKRAS
jgi:hypothetical protein